MTKDNHSSLYYSAYGLRICSNDVLHGLEETEAFPNPDVVIRLRAMPPGFAPDAPIWRTAPKLYESERADPDSTPVLVVRQTSDGAYTYFRYYDEVDFVLDSTVSHIWVTWVDTITPEGVTPYILGPILGYVVRRRGRVCLHASAININDKAIAFVGEVGAGKSTLAGAFAQKGYPVLTDDVAPLSEQNGIFYVHSGYPRLRLGAAATETLYGAADALPLMAPDWDKRYLNLGKDAYRFETRTLPLAAIYILARRVGKNLLVSPMSAKMGLLTLIVNTYMNYLLDSGQRAHEFAFLSRLVDTVPVRSLESLNDLAQLPNLCAAALEDFHTLPGV